jgi:hypothetical protein
MSNVSSISNSSYAFRGTLSRLDTNGDGVLSQEEIAASERPGILGEDGKENNDNALNNSQVVLGNIIALMMQSAPFGNQGTYSAGSATESDLQVTIDAYSGTYGQYDVSTMAA